MENKHIFKLVDGEFTANEASTVLLDLVNSKIKYHHLEVLSCQEKGQGDIVRSQRRINELEAVQKSLRSLLHYASHNGMYLKVNGSIEVELVEEAIPATASKR